MAEEWTVVTIGGVDYWEIETARFRVPVDWVPGSQMFIAVASGGGSGNFPAAIQGDPGEPPDLTSAVVLTVLEPDDPTSDSSSWVETSPGVYQEHRTIHKGAKGDDGDTVLDVTDFGTPLPGKIVVVNADSDALEYQTQKVGDRYWPASIANTPSGNVAYTLCSVAVAAQDFDWRPTVSGQTVVTGTGANVRVDVIARLNNETSGNIVGRGFGVAGVGPATVGLSAGPPAGSASTYDKVSAGAGATIYLRVERQSGTDTFTTSGSTTHFSVRATPIP
jgi:hypothetical protein